MKRKNGIYILSAVALIGVAAIFFLVGRSYETGGSSENRPREYTAGGGGRRSRISNEPVTGSGRKEARRSQAVEDGEAVEV